jgi:hypothetical protein
MYRRPRRIGAIDPPNAAPPHKHTEYEAHGRNRDILFGLLLLLLLLTSIGLMAWTIVQQTHIHHNHHDAKRNHRKVNDVRDKCEAINETLQECNCTELNQQIGELDELFITLNSTVYQERQAVLAKVSMTPGSALVNNTENFPFDNEHHDPFDLFNTTTHEWTADRDGWWKFLACVTFDRANTPGFDSAIAHDHQLQVWINDAFTTQGLFADIFTHHAFNDTEPELPQQVVCGENVYQLDTGDTLALRVQTRLYSATILVSSVDGGLFVATRASLYFIGE